MKRILRLFLIVLIVAGIVAGAVALVKRKMAILDGAPKYGLRPIPVKAAEAKRGDLSVKIDYLAVVEPVQETNISARVTAKIDKILCDEGDRVKKGQVLIVLDKRAARNDIASMMSQIDQIRAELAANEATVNALKDTTAYWRREAKRDKFLADNGDIPGSQAEGTADKANAFQGQLDAARRKSAGLRHLIKSLGSKKEALETRLSYYTIRSPYDGIVRTRDVDPGDMAAPGKRLLVVENRNNFKLAFDVPQQDLPGVKEGNRVTFEVNNRVREAVLSHTYPSLNLARMLRAEVNLSDEQAKGLSTGQYLPVSVVVREIKGVTLLPRACLIEGPHEETYLFLLKGDRLLPRPVKVLGTNGDRVALEGVSPGEKAVTNTFLGWARISAENRVEVQE